MILKSVSLIWWNALDNIVKKRLLCWLLFWPKIVSPALSGGFVFHKSNFQMATSKQEQIYNDIVEYYNYADRLLNAVEDSTHELASQQFAILEDVVTKLEECADKLTTQYIDFVKNGETSNIGDSMRSALNDIMAKIEECRNKTLMLYHLDEAEKNIKL